MNNQNYTTGFTIDSSAQEVFNAITNVRSWWSGEIDGETKKLGDEFTYRYQTMHMSKQKVTEFIPDKKIVWHVTDAEISFVKNKTEWKDTDIVFELFEEDGKTTLKFTHVGLHPEFECYSACSQGWDSLINTNLKNLVQSGKSQPDAFAEKV